MPYSMNRMCEVLFHFGVPNARESHREGFTSTHSSCRPSILCQLVAAVAFVGFDLGTVC